MATQWYYSKDGKQFGPLSPQAFKSLAANGELHRNDTVWKVGMKTGTLAKNVAGLFTDDGILARATTSSPNTSTSPSASDCGPTGNENISSTRDAQITSPDSIIEKIKKLWQLQGKAGKLISIAIVVIVCAGWIISHRTADVAKKSEINVAIAPAAQNSTKLADDDPFGSRENNSSEAIAQPATRSTERAGNKASSAQPSKSVASPIESISGQTAMSVQVEIHGTRDLSGSEIRTEIEKKLRQEGIRVLDPDSLAGPVLKMTIDVTSFQEDRYPIILYVDFVAHLEFYRYFQFRNARGGESLVGGSTWGEIIHGVLPALHERRIYGQCNELADDFTKEYQKANKN